MLNSIKIQLLYCSTKNFSSPPVYYIILLRVVSKKNLVFFCFVWISFFSQQMSQRSPWLVDPNGPLDKLSWWFRPCQTMFWKISWNYDFTRKILYISFQACRAFISIIWKDSMKILLLPIYYIVIWNYYLIYATFIYVCCDSFRIYCRGAKYSFFWKYCR